MAFIFDILKVDSGKLIPFNVRGVITEKWG